MADLKITETLQEAFPNYWEQPDLYRLFLLDKIQICPQERALRGLHHREVLPGTHDLHGPLSVGRQREEGLPAGSSLGGSGSDSVPNGVSYQSPCISTIYSHQDYEYIAPPEAFLHASWQQRR